MPVARAAANRVAAISNLTVIENAPLAAYTRFGIGGPAALLCDTASEAAFVAALHLVENLALPRVVIGGGTNLVVSDAGFDGVVLRFTGRRVSPDGKLLRVEAGAVLQDVVDHSIGLGLEGLQTMTGIPGFLGAAVYGNAGAYGHSIQEIIEEVRFTDGVRTNTFTNQQCRFQYRDSIFKDRKEWVILSATLRFEEGDPGELQRTANEIRSIRDAKYPPSMRCAGSIFKNLLLADLPAGVRAEIPAKVVREGKVPSAWFLEQVGGKGIRRGDIQVADYHANLIYNDGVGTAADLVAVIQELKQRVRNRFGFDLEEEVQYVGFDYAVTPG
ncbi:MAG TPA: UDP-N-acetylmuramate dehydrogenase [Bryobacteraceae bacterium]|nr:UDP-N-acetylmuramate dehydrogenase [Bryobacteraceae bacterium]